MKRIILLAIISFVCTSFANAQECKMCGVWNGAFKDEFPNGEKYRVNVEFNIQGNKKFEYSIRPADFGSGHWACSDDDDVKIVNEECNDYFIKFYLKVLLSDKNRN